jgi:hypothetical protein
MSKRLFSLKHPYWFWGHPASVCWVCGGFFTGVKWLGCEADHSSPSGTKVTNKWSYTSIPTGMLSWCANSINIYADLTVMNMCGLLSYSPSS